MYTSLEAVELIQGHMYDAKLIKEILTGVVTSYEYEDYASVVLKDVNNWAIIENEAIVYTEGELYASEYVYYKLIQDGVDVTCINADDDMTSNIDTSLDMLTAWTDARDNTSAIVAKCINDNLKSTETLIGIEGYDMIGNGYTGIVPAIDVERWWIKEFGRVPKLDFNAVLRVADIEYLYWDFDGVAMSAEEVSDAIRSNTGLFVKFLYSCDNSHELFHFLFLIKMGYNKGIMQKILDVFYTWNDFGNTMRTHHAEYCNKYGIQLTNDAFEEMLRKLGDMGSVSLNTKPKDLMESNDYTCYNGFTDDVSDIAKTYKLDVYDVQKAVDFATDNKVSSSVIPRIPVISIGKYTIEMINDGDITGLLLGKITNCCQYLGGAGGSCAEHGYLSSKGGFIVVKRNGKIVAQSWIWVNNGVLVFDNIESLSSGYINTVAVLYQKAADEFVKAGVSQVRVGTGYDKLGVVNFWNTADDITQVPDECYSDAVYHQLIVDNDILRMKYVELTTYTNVDFHTMPIYKAEFADWVSGWQYTTVISDSFYFILSSFNEIVDMAGTPTMSDMSKIMHLVKGETVTGDFRDVTSYKFVEKFAKKVISHEAYTWSSEKFHKMTVQF